MSFLLLSAILRNPWYIDHDFVVSHAPLIANLLSKGPVRLQGPLSEELSRVPYTIAAASTVSVSGSIREGYNYDSIPKGSKAVIPIKGVLLKEDQDDGCGYFVAGMNTLAQRIHEADLHENINSIILHFDSPGGTVDGTHALADAVKNVQKPIVAFVDGMLGSAAYFIASSCDSIIAENTSALIGSIGTMISMVDEQPYFEKMGVKFHNIVSDLSPDKNADFMAAREGDYNPIKKNLLNPFAKIFQDYVQANRPELSGDSIQGKVFLAEEALKRKLIDSIGPIQSAVSALDQMTVLSGHSTNTKTRSTMKNLPLLIALLSVESLESTDEGVFLNEDQLQLIEQRIAAAIAQEKLLQTANDLNAGQSLEITNAKAEIVQLNEQIAGLKKLPAVIPAAAASSSDRIPDSSEDIIQACETLSTSDAIAAVRKGGY
ncbi:MAG: S49 family peptidase [Lentimicrobium sp.]